MMAQSIYQTDHVLSVQLLDTLSFLLQPWTDNFLLALIAQTVSSQQTYHSRFTLELGFHFV